MSMMGGAEIFIRSNGGFDDMPPQNSIVLESQNIADAKFAGHRVTGKFFCFLILYFGR